jgi:hypothetical protein
MDRLRRASMASSNSDLANSLSPPTVRFTIDTATILANSFGSSPSTRKKSPPLSSRTIQHSASNSSLGQQQNSKLIFDTSPMKSRGKLTDIGRKYFLFLQMNLFVYFLRFT